VHGIREWEMLAVEYPDLLEAQVGLAETLWRAYRAPAAADRCRRILANAPACVKALLILAAIHHDTGNEAEAQRLVRSALELDPDQRLGQTLFADRLAGGDEPLRHLLLGDARAAAPASSPTDRQGDAARARRAVSRPLIGSRPLTDELGTRVPGPPTTGALSSRPLTPMASRPSALPPEFHSIFSEAEYMIWGPDEEGRHPSGGPSAGRATPGPRPDAALRAVPLVPPALVRQGANMDDTEVRAAVNWIHWLQAQGAQVHPDATQPAAPPPQGASQQGASQQGASQQGASQQGAGATGSLPPPTPEALRAMFAELAPEDGADGRGIVEADAVAGAMRTATPTGAPSAPPTEHTEAPSALSDEASADPWRTYAGEPEREDRPGTVHSISWSDASAPSAWVSEANPRESADATEQVEAAPQRSTSSSAGGDARPDATLEGLEREFSASGFQTFEPHPGALAALAGTPAAADEAPIAAPGAPVAPDAPAPDDYVARLDLARRLRRAGHTEEALVEYRAVLKNAPALLDTMLDELHESLATTPEDPAMHRLLGDARIRQGDYLGALESYNRAVALTPNSDY
ncbi:MAG: tetratricopeptide repeat protein, partial [Ktedonobacterales bacterium]|nr:tetratricopeptide repeat protein [Ktedonobacterales bacterium]